MEFLSILSSVNAQTFQTTQIVLEYQTNLLLEVFAGFTMSQNLSHKALAGAHVQLFINVNKHHLNKQNTLFVSLTCP